MKKLMLVIIALSSIAFADNDCSAGAQKVVDKLAAHNRTSVTLTYSADQEQKAKACTAAIKEKNPAITVNLVSADGTNVFKFSK